METEFGIIRRTIWFLGMEFCIIGLENSNCIMETWILIDGSGEFHWKKLSKQIL